MVLPGSTSRSWARSCISFLQSCMINRMATGGRVPESAIQTCAFDMTAASHCSHSAQASPLAGMILNSIDNWFCVANKRTGSAPLAFWIALMGNIYDIVLTRAA